MCRLMHFPLTYLSALYRLWTEKRIESNEFWCVRAGPRQRLVSEWVHVGNASRHDEIDSSSVATFRD